MNERIEKLGEQADLLGEFTPTKIPGRYVGYITEEQILKFAELIVRECIMVCWPGGESDILYEQASAIDKAFIDGQDACVERLKQHFGVES